MRTDMLTIQDTADPVCGLIRTAVIARHLLSLTNPASDPQTFASAPLDLSMTLPCST